MSLSINNHSLSLHAQRQFTEHSTEASRLIARLTSGARIEGASDEASVSGGAGSMSLNIDMADFGGAPQYSDRVIAHEMVHAVMLSATSFDFNGAGWFTEGMAELIQGADERVAAGASGNRLDLASNNVQTASTNLEAARGRIQDIDYANTTARLTRAQILQQAASAIMTQANGEPRAVLALLR